MLRALSRTLAYLWALPITAIGLLLLPLTLFRGGRVRFVSGVLEAQGPAIAWILRRLVPLRGGARAMTLGHVVLGRTALDLLHTRAHERAHVRQTEMLGPLFAPAYFLAGVYAWLRGKRAYRDNVFERQARSAENAPSTPPRIPQSADRAFPGAAAPPATPQEEKHGFGA